MIISCAISLFFYKLREPMKVQRYYILINQCLGLLFFLTCILSAQQAAGQTQFKDSVFPSVTVYDSIVYGEARNFAGTQEEIHVDIYVPAPLDDRERPLVILSHGGSFLNGDRKSPDIVIFCNELAKRGYICASIDYRKGINVLKDFKDEFAKAMWRAMLDHRTAVRFFRSSYVLGNPYHIDTSQIFVGGVSAGGIASLHAAFLDDASEIPANINTQSLGNLFDGDHAFVPSSFKGVINMYGAISRKDYIDPSPVIDVCNIHGTSDQTVPYKSSVYAPNNIEIEVLHGSYIVDSVARSHGLNSLLKPLHNKGHVPYTREPEYADTTVNFLIDCLYPKAKLGGIVSAPEVELEGETIKIWRDQKQLFYRLNELPENCEITIFNLRGQAVHKFNPNGQFGSMPLTSNLQSIHFVRVTTGKTTFYQKI